MMTLGSGRRNITELDDVLGKAGDAGAAAGAGPSRPSPSSSLGSRARITTRGSNLTVGVAVLAVLATLEAAEREVGGSTTRTPAWQTESNWLSVEGKGQLDVGVQ